MLYFRAKSEAEVWCQANSRRLGAILSLSQVWELSKLWYSDRMAPDFRGRALESALDIFRTLGLTGDFWAA